MANHRALIASLLSALCLLAFLASREHVGSNNPALFLTAASNKTVTASYYHLIIHASEQRVDACRTLISAAILGYPTPQLLGLHNVTEDSPESFPRSSFAETMAQTRDHLDSLADRGDDIVLVIADQDYAWMQLRPQTLLNRYLRMSQTKNGAASSILLPAGHGDGQSNAMNVTGGTVIGPVSAMRRLFTEVESRARSDSKLQSQQQILSSIFIDQQAYREALKQDASPWSFAGRLSQRDEAFVSDHDPDFGIEMDQSTAIAMNCGESVFGPESCVGIIVSEKDLNSDIADTLPPFWTFTTEPDLPRKALWTDSAFLGSASAGSAQVPALIAAGSNSTLRDDMWTQMWYQWHLRPMFNAHIYNPIVPLATTENDTSITQWWSREIWKGGAPAPPVAGRPHGWWVKFDDYCRGYDKAIFADGKGPWVLPDDH